MFIFELIKTSLALGQAAEMSTESCTEADLSRSTYALNDFLISLPLGVPKTPYATTRAIVLQRPPGLMPVHASASDSR